MDIFSELEIGDKLSIEIRDKDIDQAENSMLNTQLIDIDAGYLYISPPIYKGKQYSLYKGQKINLLFYRKKGIYQFNAQIVKKIDTNIVTFVLKHLGDTQKIQRRNSYRLPIVSSVILERYENDRNVKIECVTKDLSGSGVRVVTKYEIEKSENVIVRLYIGETQVITINGEVVRVIKNSQNNTYELGIKFKDMDEIDRDKIFAFIFEKQRLMRKKGLM